MNRRTVGIHEAKTTFSRLVRQVEAGGEVVVENHGRPVARLVGYAPAPAPRKPGMFAGQIELAPGFEELPEGFTDAFE